MVLSSKKRHVWQAVRSVSIARYGSEVAAGAEPGDARRWRTSGQEGSWQRTAHPPCVLELGIIRAILCVLPGRVCLASRKGRGEQFWSGEVGFGQEEKSAISQK